MQFHILIVLLQISSLPGVQTETDNRASVFGYVLDADTGEKLRGTNVYLMDIGLGTTTNTSGYYRLQRIPEGTYKLRITYLSYKPFEREITFEAGEDKQLDVDLQEGDFVLEEITIRSERNQEERHNIGRHNITMQDIGRKPGLFQDDVFHAIQLLPGIAASSDFSSGLHIRGGGPDQTLIQLDEATVYNPTHFFGFFSTFNSDAIKDVELYKGTYPAKYGGRLGSVVDIYNRDGNRQRHGAGLSFGLLSSSVMVEGPIPKGSYLATFRRSTLEPLFTLYGSGTPGVPDKFYFYDLNARVSHDINKKNNLTTSIYTGTDDVGLSFDDKTNLNFRYGNQTFSTAWTHIASSSLITKVRLSGSQFDSHPFTNIGGTDFERTNQISEYTLKADADWFPSSKLEISAGISGGRMSFKLADIFNSMQTLKTKNRSWNIAGYVQNVWRPTTRWRINAGVRGEFISRGNYWRTGPRLSADYYLTPKLRIQTGYGRYYQFMNLVTNQTFTGFDVWLMADDRVPPSYSDQFAVGTKYGISESWDLELEGYYRTMKDLFELDPFLGDAAGFEYHELFRFGEGYAYGVEAMLERTSERVNGFVGYTFGRTWRRFPGYNKHRFYPPRFDRTHDLTVVLNYNLSAKWQFSSTFTYQTGQAYTKPLGRSGLTNNPLDNNHFHNLSIVGKINASRMPAYHRLDVAAIRKGNFFDIATSELKFQVINLYSRRNIWFFIYEYDVNPPDRQEILLLPILPSVTYSLMF